MNIKTNLLEDYVNFVDSTKKESYYYIINIVWFVIIISLFLVFFSIPKWIIVSLYITYLKQAILIQIWDLANKNKT